MSFVSMAQTRSARSWAATIERLAEEADIDLIVMGTAGRSGVAGFFIGNTAEDMLQSVHCAVLVVKPPGFITPIRQ